jgi:hypothetical protein
MNNQFTLIALVSTIIGIGLTPILSLQSTYAAIENGAQLASTSSKKSDSFVSTGEIEQRKAPIAITGDNVYVAWWTNKTGNDEVMFRASTDGGKTFGDKINLSNSTKADSQDTQIDASGDRVFVTWWERNATSNEPVLRISNDNGKTFGEIFRLSANGIIGSSG